MSSVDLIITLLEREWEQPNGFLGKLRLGVFDNEGLERLISILQDINLASENVIDRRLVELLWFIPLFMSWQKERIQGKEVNEILMESAFQRVLNLMYQILGTP